MIGSQLKVSHHNHHQIDAGVSVVAVLEADTSGESCRESSPTMERDAAGARDRLVSRNPAMGERGTAGPRNGLYPGVQPRCAHVAKSRIPRRCKANAGSIPALGFIS